MIPRGPITLFDDDTVTGQTAEHARALLQGKCIIDRFITLCDSKGPIDCKTPLRRARLNQFDCRNFLAGARQGGLVLELSDGETCRARYLLPYTNPNRRAGIPPTKEVSFSMAVWQLNKRFFSGLPTRLEVSDMDKAFWAACAS